jgi:WD40 repeat protein
VRVLEGHTGSVRCLDVWCGVGEEVLQNKDAPHQGDSGSSTEQSRKLTRRVRQRRCVSGSYDGTCRLWDVDTGECIHVLRGHFSQIYSVAFDGVRVVSGGLDTTVRVWDADSGQCIALLQGHTALVCQLQLFRVPNASMWSYPPSPLPTSSSSAAASSSHRGHDASHIALSGAADDTEYTTILATGGSDGRVITFSLATYTALHRIAAHDSSVTAMQLGGRFLVTAGNDGRARLYEARGGGPPSHGRQDSAEALLHPQQYYHNGDTGLVMGSDGAGNNTPDANGGFAFSPLHDQRARDAERGARLGVYRYVRDLSSAGETVWKAAFGRDTLVLAGRKGGRGVVEVWTMDPRNKMVRLKGKVKDKDA